MSTRPELVVVCGLPGVGKSTVSSLVTDVVDGVRLRSEVVRNELFEEPPYTEESREKVYEELFERASSFLGGGTSVVVDATFREHDRRLAAREVAHTADARFRLLYVVCEREIAEERIATRDDISDADVEVYRDFRAAFDPVELDHDRVDNSGSLSQTRVRVESLFRD